MSKKINIQMFGYKNDVVSIPCGWGPSSDCGPSEDSTTIEMYEELKKFLEDTDVKDKFELSYIDLNEDDLNPYPNERKVIEKGHKLPLTFIEGKVAFKGPVDNMRTYLIVSKMYNTLY